MEPITSYLRPEDIDLHIQDMAAIVDDLFQTKLRIRQSKQAIETAKAQFFSTNTPGKNEDERSAQIRNAFPGLFEKLDQETLLEARLNNSKEIQDLLIQKDRMIIQYFGVVK